MLDKDRLLEKMDELEKYLRELDEYLPEEEEEYLSSGLRKRAYERAFQLASENLPVPSPAARRSFAVSSPPDLPSTPSSTSTAQMIGGAPGIDDGAEFPAIIVYTKVNENDNHGALRNFSQNYKYHQTLYFRYMAQRSRKQGKLSGSSLKKHVAASRAIPPFRILGKKDIEKELSKIENKFGMTPEDFHKAWREGKVHGHEAVKLGCYYEFYKDEYE